MNHRSPTSVTAFMLLVAALGCASTASPDVAQPAARNAIVRVELEGFDDLSAYEAIRRLKPGWLRYRGQSVLTSPGREGLRVYVNGSLYGEADALSQIRVPDIERIEYLDARVATLRFGTGHTVGAILITTRRGIVGTLK